VRRLAAVCEVAAALGLYPGQPLAAARAICPHLAVADADPETDRAALEVLASWCERYTPLAAADPPSGLWLDITGCAHLFGGEAGLAADLSGRLKRQAIPCRLAAAGTPGAAWALARSAHGPEDKPIILAPGEERSALAPLPVASLRLEERIASGLRRLGLKTVGDLLHIPRAELAARFGDSVLLRLDQALGAAEEAILWPHPPQPWETRLAFAEPIATPEDLARTLALLSERLCQRLAEKRLGGHRFICRFHRVEGATPRIEVATALPVHDAAYLTKLLNAKLETVDPGFGIEAAVLGAEEVEPFCPAQERLLGPRADASGKLAAVVDTLGNRLAPEHLWGVAPRESHVPEQAVERVPPMAPRRAPWTADPSRPRPVRLLRRPEPIEVTAPVPDDPPLLFRWRGALHRVRAASGPERIATEWWHRSPAVIGGRPETDLVRDYYRVEDAAGSRFWVFRAGLRNGGRWFLHGLFG
jgi:protein ImuB